MDANDVTLISKYVNQKSFMAVMMFVQASSAANIAFSRYSNSYSNLKSNPPAMVVQLLVDARFFSEACGWCALAIRRLRFEDKLKIKEYLTKNEKLINSLYNVRTLVNHTYNEDLAESYRKNNYKEGTNQKGLAFNFSPNSDGVSFRIGTLEVNMISQLASIQKLKLELLAIDPE